MACSSNSFDLQIQQLDVEDLEYVERDLTFYELTSLGFLLFGDERSHAEFILQKLLVLAQSQKLTPINNTDLLREYARINPKHWRACMVEALTIIGAKRVLRKLGLSWQNISEHYLPHVAEFSRHIHPLLKALYIICERLNPSRAGPLILDINEQYKRLQEHLRFYEHEYLEIFFLDWITRSIIKLGGHDMSGADMQVLLSYFKMNDLEELRMLLMKTIQRDDNKCDVADTKAVENDVRSVEALKSFPNTKDNCNELHIAPPYMNSTASIAINHDNCYLVRRSQAGIVLIINQRKFHTESATEYKHLLPGKKLCERVGTEIDKQRLIDVFTSFGYELVLYEDLDHIMMLHHIRETCKRALLYDSIILCILSHGIDGAVYGSNSIPVKISDIEEIVTADTLEDKPKMLIIQACQKSEATQIELKKSSSASYISPTAYTDILKAMSTMPGYESMRHTTTGTWFIQSLCDAIDKYGDKKHMLDILTIVTSDVTNKRGNQNEVMVPLTSSTLRKCFCLPNRVV